ncbi:MAG: PaaI family thioesterase [Clostridia bacterium]|nr:PaaI family thioesterase [Clostridia bacterium]
MGGDFYWLAVDEDQKLEQAVRQPRCAASGSLRIEVAEVGPGGRSLLRLPVLPGYLDSSKCTLRESVYAALAHRSMLIAARACGKQVATMNLQVGYMRPVEVGQVVECRGIVIYAGQQVVVTGARMYVGDKPVATAGGMFSITGSDCSRD